MADRLTVDEFFEALRAQGLYPLIDTPRARKVVEAVVRAYGAHYPIQGRWPVLDLESAYEGHLNTQPELAEFCRQGYSGRITLRGFDDTYSLDEWFADFRIPWGLVDTPRVRHEMLGRLPPGPQWKSPLLCAAYEAFPKETSRAWPGRGDEVDDDGEAFAPPPAGRVRRASPSFAEQKPE